MILSSFFPFPLELKLNDMVSDLVTDKSSHLQC